METTEERLVRWKKLPPKMREILSSEQWTNETIALLEKIGAEHGLSVMEQGFLMRITGKVMSGVILPTDFVKAVLDQIDVTQDQAILIEEEVNREVFNPVKELIKEVHRLSETYFEDEELGIRITKKELLLANASTVDELTAIPIDQIGSLELHSAPDWKFGLCFVGFGLFLLYFVSGWAYLISVAPMAFGTYILLHPSQRLYKVKVLGEPRRGYKFANYQMKALGGPSGRKRIEMLVEAFKKVKDEATKKVAA